MNTLEALRTQFNDHLRVEEKRPGITQLFVPLFHEDGDMVDLYLEEAENGKVRVCDHGMTLMRLSYDYELDTPNKLRILEKILSENGLTQVDGNIQLECAPESLYPAVLQFAQGVAKVGSMSRFRREIVASLFYDMLEDFAEKQLTEFHPQKKLHPIPDRDDLEVDIAFRVGGVNLFLFAVKDAAKARLATISCLEFIRSGIPFRSLIVHDDFDNLPRKDRSRLTSASDKQFTSLEDFRTHGRQFLEREAVH